MFTYYFSSSPLLSSPFLYEVGGGRGGRGRSGWGAGGGSSLALRERWSSWFVTICVQPRASAQGPCFIGLDHFVPSCVKYYHARKITMWKRA